MAAAAKLDVNCIWTVADHHSDSDDSVVVRLPWSLLFSSSVGGKRSVSECNKTGHGGDESVPLAHAKTGPFPVHCDIR